MAKKESEGTESRERRMQVDLDTAINAEIESWCELHPIINRSAVRDLIRTAATEAANAAVIGRVEEIVRRKLGL